MGKKDLRFMMHLQRMLGGAIVWVASSLAQNSRVDVH